MGKLGEDKTFVPGPNHVFVFGSNEAGYHGGGAARTALEKYGAKMYQGYGLAGSSFAVPTKDHDIETLPLAKIATYVARLAEFAQLHPKTELFVTRIGCGLAGYTDTDIAPLFKGAPRNMELPYGWRELNGEPE